MVQREAEHGKGLEVGTEDAAGALRTRVWLEQGNLEVKSGGQGWDDRLGPVAEGP